MSSRRFKKGLPSFFVYNGPVSLFTWIQFFERPSDGADGESIHQSGNFGNKRSWPEPFGFPEMFSRGFGQTDIRGQVASLSPGRVCRKISDACVYYPANHSIIQTLSRFNSETMKISHFRVSLRHFALT
jgi:hypothetical protein